MATSPRVTDATESIVTLTVAEWEQIYRALTNRGSDLQPLAQKVWAHGIVAPQDKAREARTKSTSHTNRCVRLTSLKHGDKVQIKFSDDDYEEAIFVSLDEDGQRATFQSRNESDVPYFWEAYRFNHRWVYGTSADRLSFALPA